VRRIPRQLRVALREFDIDKLLVYAIPNMTVMRRLIAAGYIMLVIAITVLVIQTRRIDGNTKRSAAAICLIAQFAERVSPSSSTENGRDELARLAAGTRDLVQSCSPPEAVPNP
jgi:hypothetical protein